MMSHDPYELEMSLILDGLSSEGEENLLRRIDEDFDRREAFERMRRVDSLLQTAPMATPPANFVTSVMQGVEQVERRRQVYPLLISLLVVLSLTVTIFFAVPWLIVSLNLYEPLLQLPAVTSLLAFFNQVASSFAWFVDWIVDVIKDWFTLLRTDPSALLVTVAGLAFVSIWIGLREGVKAERAAVEA